MTKAEMQAIGWTAFVCRLGRSRSLASSVRLACSSPLLALILIPILLAFLAALADWLAAPARLAGWLAGLASSLALLVRRAHTTVAGSTGRRPA